MKKHRSRPAPLPAPTVAPQYERVFYRTAVGREPVREWFEELADNLKVELN